MNTQPVLIRDGDIYSGYNFIGENIPIGVILPLMGLTAPTGYLICDGTTHLIEDYPDLTEFFKTQFGSSNFFGGDGVTTFKVPDLRGEFLRGTGTNGHANQGSGANVGVHQDGTQHMNISGNSSENAFFIPEITITTPPLADSIIVGNNYRRKHSLTGSDTNAANYYTSRPTNTSVNFIIKAFVSPATGDSGESKTPIRYSTEEQWTGKYWIDGKKIYQKVVNIPDQSTANGRTELSVQGLNIDIPIGAIRGTAIYNNTVKYALPLELPAEEQRNSIAGFRFSQNEVIFSSFNWTNKFTSIYAVLEYTKTTD